MRVAVLLLAFTAPCAAQSRTVAVGVMQYNADGMSPLRFAAREAELVAKELRARPLAETSLPALERAIQEALATAGRKDTVVLFLSARGRALPGEKAGFVAASDSAPDKLESTWLPTYRLEQWIARSDAQRVVLFTDLCREPRFGSVDNRINDIVKRLQRVSRPEVVGLVASEPPHPSKDAPERQAGVFTVGLIDGLRANKRTPDDLLAFLQSRRKPGDPAPALFMSNKQLGQTDILTPVLSGMAWPKALPLLAWAGPDALRIPGLLARLSQTGPAREFRNPAELDAAVADLLRERDNSAAWEQRRAALALRLEEMAHRLAARYGAGDQFPNDPEKLRPFDFALAAAAGRNLLALAPYAPEWERERLPRLQATEMFLRGAAAYALDNRRDAATILDEARKRSDALPEAANAFGVFEMESGHYASAIRAFSDAKGRSPLWAYPRHNLALAYAETGDYASAEREYREAIRGAADYPYLHYNYGLMLHRTNRIQQARRSYEETLKRIQDRIGEMNARIAISEDPAERDRLRARIRAFEDNRAQVWNAIGALNETIAENAKDPGRYLAEALRRYGDALRADPANVAARYNQAKLEQKLAEPGIAPGVVVKLEAIAAENPRFHPSRLLLGQLYLRLGQTDKARREFEVVCNLVAANVDARLGLALAHAQSGDYAKAMAGLEAAADLDMRQHGSKRPGAVRPGTYAAFATVYKARGDTEAACEALQNAVRSLRWWAYPAGKAAKLRAEQKACQGHGGQAPPR